jgi:hypothetical protein
VTQTASKETGPTKSLAPAAGQEIWHVSSWRGGLCIAHAGHLKGVLIGVAKGDWLLGCMEWGIRAQLDQAAAGSWAELSPSA